MGIEVRNSGQHFPYDIFSTSVVQYNCRVHTERRKVGNFLNGKGKKPQALLHGLQEPSFDWYPWGFWDGKERFQCVVLLMTARTELYACSFPPFSQQKVYLGYPELNSRLILRFILEQYMSAHLINHLVLTQIPGNRFNCVHKPDKLPGADIPN